MESHSNYGDLIESFLPIALILVPPFLDAFHVVYEKWHHH